MGSLPYKFKCIDLDTYRLEFLIRIQNNVMKNMFKRSLRAHAKKTGMDVDASLDDERVTRFAAPENLHGLLNTGMHSFWNDATSSVLKNSEGKVKCVSRRIESVFYERQPDKSWACLVVFTGEYVDGR